MMNHDEPCRFWSPRDKHWTKTNVDLGCARMISSSGEGKLHCCHKITAVDTSVHGWVHLKQSWEHSKHLEESIASTAKPSGASEFEAFLGSSYFKVNLNQFQAIFLVGNTLHFTPFLRNCTFCLSVVLFQDVAPNKLCRASNKLGSECQGQSPPRPDFQRPRRWENKWK